MKLRIGILGIFVLLANSAFSQEDREVTQPRDKIIASLGIGKGMKIGEVGVGSGYLTFHLAKQVGNSGEVFANEINTYSLQNVSDRIERENIKNIKTVVGTEYDPKFPEKGLDKIVMLMVLHHLDKPVDFMKNLSKYLKKGGELIVIERNSSHDREHEHHFMSEQQIIGTLQKSGYTLVRKATFLPKDTIYFLTYSHKEF